MKTFNRSSADHPKSTRRIPMQRSTLLLVIVGAALSTTPLFAYHTGTVYAMSLSSSTPHGCSDTVYDPEVTVVSGGDLELYGQGQNSSRLVDEVFAFRRDQSTGQWTVPSGNGSPAFVGWYSRCGYNASAFGPIASPSIVKVGSTWYMAYSGGNADNITGRVYWAVSSDGIAWSRYAVNAGAEGITPLIYGKYHNECSGLDGINTASGVGQVELAYDNGYFYFFLRYGHYSNGTQQTPGAERIAYRIQYNASAAAGLGTSRQIYYDGTWQSNSGHFVWTYDTGTPDSINGVTDQVLSIGHSATAMQLGAGDVKYDPATGWVHFYQPQVGNAIGWEYTSSLSNPVWSAGGTVDTSSISSTYPGATIYYPGVYFYNATLGGLTGNYIFIPIQETSCGGDFAGVRIISAQLLPN